MGAEERAKEFDFQIKHIVKKKKNLPKLLRRIDSTENIGHLKTGLNPLENVQKVVYVKRTSLT